MRFVGVHVDVTGARGAQTAERRSAFLSEAGPLLDASLDLRSTLDSLTRLSVPYLGDVCLVDGVEFGEVRRLAAAAADPAVERLVRALPTTYPVRPGDPIARAIDSGRSEILAGAGAGVFGPAAKDAGSCRPTSRAPRCSCR